MQVKYWYVKEMAARYSTIRFGTGLTVRFLESLDIDFQQG